MVDKRHRLRQFGARVRSKLMWSAIRGVGAQRKMFLVDGWMTLRITGRGQWIYLAHIVGLVMPGVGMPVHTVHQIEPAPLGGWPAADLDLMIEEGRRQADRQMTDFDRVGGRAQWLFTVAAAMIVTLASRFALHHRSGFHLALWIVGLAFLTLGVAGAAALMATRADFGQIDTAVFSHVTEPRRRELAVAYSRMLRTGENTIATRITVYRQAIVYVIVGSYVTLIAYLVSH
jgi:hypothetical protein